MKSAIYLEGKETSAGKKHSWNTPKQHLTANYSEIPYGTHAINVYDTLQQGPDEPAEAYLHRTQDILEHIHHTNNMSEITAIGTDHAQILTSLKDKKLCSKLAESKAKKWSNMAKVLQDVAEMAITFKRSRGYSLPSFEINQTTAYSHQHPSNSQHYNTNKQYPRETQHSHAKPEKSKCWNAKVTILRKIAP